MNKENFLTGRVTAEHKERYEVTAENRQYLANVKGKLLHEAKSREDYPAVGDRVAISPTDDGHALIEEILPRKSILRKKYNDKTASQLIAANIDVAFIVQAVDRDFNINKMERLIVLAEDGKILPTIVLNKVDLISEEELDVKKSEIVSRFGNIDLFAVSTVSKEGFDRLAGYIEKDKIYCFLGSSGVGKSSIINALLDDKTTKTGTIGEKTQRGKHTTTVREMHFLKNGGMLIDNPGIREVGMVDTEAGVKVVFGDIIDLSKECKFPDCTHTNEPRCAVLSALESGEISEDQYDNYTKIKKESDFYEMTELEKRKKDRSFGKFKKTALDQFDKRR
jgi:ribosome biogenesis GTPase